MQGFSSDSVVTPVEPRSNLLPGLILGLLLLLPGVLLYGYIKAAPALNVYRLSLTDYNILSEPEDIGMANYERLGEDAIFGQALGYTFSIVALRLFIVAIIPPLIGLLAGAQAGAGRTLIRSLTIIGAVLAVPLVLAIFWRMFLAPVWGTQPSPLQLDQSLMLNSPDGARNAILVIDGIITLAIAGAVGGSAFMAVARGRSVSDSAARAGIGVWLLGLLLTLASAAVTFDLPYILTNGGPGRSTTTVPLYLYQQGFVNLRLGYAAAIGTVWMLFPALAAVFIWLVTVAFRLRISFTPAPEPTEGAGFFGLLSFPAALLIMLPPLGLVLFGILQAAGASGAGPAFNTAGLLSATLTGPLLAIWVVQIPITWLAGLALGFIRPIHRVVSEGLFLLFLIVAFLPAGVLMLDWYLIGRDLGALNTSLFTGFASLVSGFSLLVFKLFFDGARERYAAVREAGQEVSDAFLNAVILPSLPLALLVGTVLTLASAGSLLWPLLVINSQSNYTFPLVIAMTVSQFSASGGDVARVALPFVLALAAVFVPVLVLLGALVVDRLAILAGPDAVYTIAKRKKRKTDDLSYENF